MDSASQCLPDKSEGNPVWSNFIFWYPLPVYFIKMCLGHAKECGSEYWNLLLETCGHVLLCHWARSVNTGCVYHCVSYTDFRPECCPDQVKYILSIWIQVPVNQILVRNINLGFWKLYIMKHLICKWPCLYLTPPHYTIQSSLFQSILSTISIVWRVNMQQWAVSDPWDISGLTEVLFCPPDLGISCLALSNHKSIYKIRWIM